MANFFFQATLRESLVGVGVTASVFLLSLLGLRLDRRGYHRPWFGLATSLLRCVTGRRPLWRSF
jgi:hypothetical protein